MKLFDRLKKDDKIIDEKVEHIVCPRCKQKVVKEAIICPFCKFGILAYVSGDVDENGNAIKK